MSAQANLPLDFSLCQRWNKKRDSYRPAGECFDPRYATVERIDTASAKRFVCTHHYSGSFQPCAHQRRLVHQRAFQKEQPAGVATFSCSSDAGGYTVPTRRPRSVTRGRAWSFRSRRFGPRERRNMDFGQSLPSAPRPLPEVQGIVSLLYPAVRPLDGRISFGGHVGTIYWAQCHAARLLKSAQAASDARCR